MYSKVTQLHTCILPHFSTLAWKIPWTEEPGRLYSPWGVTKSRTRLSDFTFTFHFDALEKEMATHSSVLFPLTGEPGGLPSRGSHRVGHDWSDLAAAAYILFNILFHYSLSQDADYISLCYIVGPCCLSSLYVIVYVYQSQTPSLSLSLHLVTTSLFFMSVSLFRRQVDLWHILDSTYKWYHVMFVFLTYFTWYNNL